jgi:UDP-glucuronate 4-epimerase
MNILITGCAGFIGFHTSQKFLSEGFNVIGIDNLNSYYDNQLKKDRLKKIQSENFEFYKFDLNQKPEIKDLFQKYNFDYVINLAAQAGVRYSITNPEEYMHSNILGFLNILELSREFKIKHLVYASSSSVYGMNKKIPFSVSDNVDHPISLYAASKKSNELMAHTYSHLFNIPSTGLRFFTVYGPWGRPDMALFIFTKSIIEGERIKLFNHGNMLRDFTYIDDIVDGIFKLTKKAPKPQDEWSSENSDPSTSSAPYRIFNIGNNRPVKLIDFIEIIESCIGKKAKIDLTEMQPGDVESTFANIDAIQNYVDFKPETNVEKGIENFVSWYKRYYKKN